MEVTKEVKQQGSTGSVDALNVELDGLEEEYTEIREASIVSEDGVVIAVRPEGSGDEKLPAISAFLLNSAQKSVRSLDWSEVGYLVVNHPDGYLIVVPAGKATLTLVTSPRAKLGLLLYDVREAARRIKRMLESE